MKDVRISICEDEPIVALDIHNLLKENGYSDIFVIRSLRELINSSGDKIPDIIITDIIKKEGISTIDAVKEIYKIGRQVGVIYLTAVSQFFENQEQNELSLFVDKPFIDSNLLESIEILSKKIKKA